MQRDLGVTTLYVTHDQVEAMTMGDRVAVMRKGELQQVADPQTLYDRPVNLFVGGFIGSPAMNMVEATLEQQNGGYVAKLGDQPLALSPRRSQARPALAAYAGRTVILGIRPEDLEDAELATDTPADRRLHGTTGLTRGARLGDHGALHDPGEARRHRGRARARRGRRRRPRRRRAGQEDQATFVGRFGPRSSARAGQALEVAVDTRSLHFFDPDSGLGIYDGTAMKGAAQ